LTIIKLFNTLKDGKWHQISEIAHKTKVKTDKLTEFFLFLSTQGIITYEEKTNRIKIVPEWQNLLPTETEPPSPPRKKPTTPKPPK
jgi:hypothetical protein